MVSDEKGVGPVGEGASECEVEPLIVTVGIGVVLEEEGVGVGVGLAAEGGEEVAALEAGVELQSEVCPARLTLFAILLNLPLPQLAEVLAPVALAALQLDFVLCITHCLRKVPRFPCPSPSFSRPKTNSHSPPQYISRAVPTAPGCTTGLLQGLPGGRREGSDP